jgi:hypothetical protein
LLICKCEKLIFTDIALLFPPSFGGGHSDRGLSGRTRSHCRVWLPPPRLRARDRSGQTSKLEVAIRATDGQPRGVRLTRFAPSKRTLFLEPTRQPRGALSMSLPRATWLSAFASLSFGI